MTAPRTTALRRRLAAAAALALLLTACGGGDDDAADGAGAPAADMTEAPAAAAGGDAVVTTAETDLGEVLVDADGLTLYGFTDDSGGTSSCSGDCAATWPPVIVEEGFAVGGGLDEGTFATTEREDGTLQLVAGDWPLYRYAADAAPGDVNGQAVGGVWFVVDAAGELVME